MLNPTGRTAIFQGARAVALAATPAPAPGPGEVRVRLEGCGVCGSNLPVWEGRPWFEYPRPAGSPGHEGWGRIESVGPGADPRRIGERVAVLSYHAFADFDIAPEENAVTLPPALDGQPFPGEALGCAMNVFRRCGVHAGETVAVVGIGFLGAVLVNLLARAGAHVVAISRRPFAREIARRLGAGECFSLEDTTATIAAVRALTGGAGCPCVVEATGLQEPLDVAGELTAEGGRLVIAGYHQDGPRRVNLQLWNWRGLDVFNAHERDPRRYREGMRAAADAVAEGRLDPSPLYTGEFGLEDIGRAFAEMGGRRPGFMKAIITFA